MPTTALQDYRLARIEGRIDLAMHVLDDPTPPPRRAFTEEGDWTDELLEWTRANGISLDWLIAGEAEVLLRYASQLLKRSA